MKHIFYFIGMLFIIHELLWLLSPIDRTKSNEKFHKLSKENEGKKWDDYSKEYKDSLKSKIPYMIFFFWLLFGLFSSQWVLFGLVLLFNIIIISPLSKLTRFSISYTILHWTNSLIGLTFALFVIINAYHLHIDTYQIIKSLFQ